MIDILNDADVPDSDKRPEPPYVIRHYDTRMLWWSNAAGWVESLASATRFTSTEQRQLRLPVDGIWVQPEERFS